jgi:hypothetical protein
LNGLGLGWNLGFGYLGMDGFLNKVGIVEVREKSQDFI